jgi:hypothetical protein
VDSQGVGVGGVPPPHKKEKERKEEENREQPVTFKNSVCNIHVTIPGPLVLLCEWNIVVLEETRHFCGFAHMPMAFCTVLI